MKIYVMHPERCGECSRRWEDRVTVVVEAHSEMIAVTQERDCGCRWWKPQFTTKEAKGCTIVSAPSSLAHRLLAPLPVPPRGGFNVFSEQELPKGIRPFIRRHAAIPRNAS